MTVAYSKSQADLWHQQLGHFNELQLKAMASHNLVKGMKIPKSSSVSFCEECVEAKMFKKPCKPLGERSVQQCSFNVCIVMYVDLCLQNPLVGKDILTFLLMTTRDIVKFILCGANLKYLTNSRSLSCVQGMNVVSALEPSDQTMVESTCQMSSIIPAV